MTSAEQTSQPKESRKIPLIVCVIVSIVAVITLVIGIIIKNPYVIIAGILPAAIYELWRTGGFYTKFWSLILFVLAILQIFVIAGLLKINITTDYGNARFLIPVFMTLLSLGLLWRTYGIYTKWLAVVLTISSITLLYLTNKLTVLHLINNIF